MSEEQYSAIIKDLIVNQSMLVKMLQVLGVEEKEVNKLANLGIKVAKQFLKNKRNGEKNGK